MKDISRRVERGDVKEEERGDKGMFPFLFPSLSVTFFILLFCLSDLGRPRRLFEEREISCERAKPAAVRATRRATISPSKGSVS